MEDKKKPSLLSGIAVSLITLFLGLLGIEIFLEYAVVNPYQWDRRLMFFSEGSVFQNKDWGGFVYQPNARIHSKTFYITDLNIPKLVTEYEYEIKTNSFGLVQSGDIADSRPSIIFLGDSFTEGQGASPWFYQLENSWPKDALYQIINGGIQGTGFEAWERLYQDISSKIEIAKVVIIFISDDWTRPVWQFSEQALECLKSAVRCVGSDNYFGLPENIAEANIQIKRVARARVEYIRERNVFKDFAIYQKLLLTVYHQWWPRFKAENEAKFEKSENIILNLVKKLGPRNILLIQLPQKDELDSGPNIVARKGIDFIRQNGLLFINGFEECGLTIVDFHVRDGHPNASGYSKIAKCVDRSVKKAFSPL